MNKCLLNTIVERRDRSPAHPPACCRSTAAAAVSVSPGQMPGPRLPHTATRLPSLGSSNCKRDLSGGESCPRWTVSETETKVSCDVALVATSL